MWDPGVCFYCHVFDMDVFELSEHVACISESAVDAHQRLHAICSRRLQFQWVSTSESFGSQLNERVQGGNDD